MNLYTEKFRTKIKYAQRFLAQFLDTKLFLSRLLQRRNLADSWTRLAFSVWFSSAPFFRALIKIQNWHKQQNQSAKCNFLLSCEVTQFLKNHFIHYCYICFVQGEHDRLVIFLTAGFSIMFFWTSMIISKFSCIVSDLWRLLLFVLHFLSTGYCMPRYILNPKKSLFG